MHCQLERFLSQKEHSGKAFSLHEARVGPGSIPTISYGPSYVPGVRSEHREMSPIPQAGHFEGLKESWILFHYFCFLNEGMSLREAMHPCPKSHN